MTFSLALASVLAFTLTLASASENLDTSDRFGVTVEELAPGVLLMRRDPSWRLPVQGNALVIINETDVVVVDGGLPSHVENIIEEIRAITSNPVSTVITTHWHGDHNIGQYVYRREFPEVRFIAHENTRAAMAGGVMQYVYDTPDTDIEAFITRQQANRETLISEGAPESRIAYIDDVIAGIDETVAEHVGYEMVLADETFSDRLTLHHGDRIIELLWFGRANTEGDAVIWLPRERIVAAGDILVRPTPYGFGSFPAEWGGVLRNIAELDYDLLVPGHGEVQYDTVHLEALADMMDEIAEAAATAVAEGAENGAAVQATIDWQPHIARFADDNELLQYLFDVWFMTPISQAAYQEASSPATEGGHPIH
jgi:cyclase